MRRSTVGLAVVCLFAAASASGADAGKRDLMKPCPAGYRKGGLHCDRLNPLATGRYEVRIPSCPPSGCPLEAGAARVDITPPPGFPMGGNGFPAHFGRGYWSRLFVRAFFFRDSANQSLALVSCDLGAMSGGLQARVAEILHKDRPDLNLSRDNLILSATHVHHGPGNFMSFKLYNDMGSREKGFDPKLFERLASRIALAIENAEGAKRNATLVVKEGKVQCLLRNRAAEPFMLNSDRDAVLKDGPSYPCNPPSAGCPCPDGDPYRADCPRFRAVDERITVVEILPIGQSDPSAAMVFFSAHPEAMSHETQLYQSDFTGLAMSRLERDNAGAGRPFVAGFFNGADGDISVRWDRQNRNEAVAFADSLYSTITSGLTESFRIDSGAKFQVARSELSSNCYFAEYQSGRDVYPAGCYGSSMDPCISGRPLYGVATLGGGEDSRSPLYDLGWNEGHRKPPRDYQGVKQGALESSFIPDPLNPKKVIDLTAQIGPPCYYPEKMPLSLIRIESGSGSLWLGAMPGEPTRTVWWRIENELARLHPQKKRVLPIGIANEYVGYLTTAEEYAAQAYEGASTVYGPKTAELWRRVFSDLVGQSHDPVDNEHRWVDADVFYPEAFSSTNCFGPDRKWMRAPHSRDDEALENLIVDAEGRPERHWPRFRWKETAGDLEKEWEGSARFVEIVKKDNTVLDDDRGSNILTVSINPKTPSDQYAWEADHPIGSSVLEFFVRRLKLEPAAQKRHWEAIWLADRYDPNNYYFRVTPNGEKPVCSESFSPSKVMSSDKPLVPGASCCP